MIDPGQIPQIAGDMGRLLEHARAIGGVGTAFPDTGGRVHSSWQGLGPHYAAPEDAQLFASTGPVATVSASVGEDLTAVSGALTTYANEVAAIQARLAALHTQALDFVNGPGADPGWRDDQGLVDQHNRMLGEVNAAVADFGDAERRCANTILALYTDRRYVPDNGDGVVDPYESGYTRELLDAALQQDVALPWGSAEEADRGFFGDVGAFFGGFWDAGGEAVAGLGALIGYADGGWSWGTAGTAWTGLGLFALSLGPVGIVNGFVDLPGLPRGTLPGVLLEAGKGLIAYDTWGEDKSRAGGMVAFNVISAIVGTKGAGAALRGAGGVAATSRVGVVANAGLGLVRAGETIGRLPSVSDTLAGALNRFRGLEIPNVDLPPGDLPPTHVDPPRIEPPRVDPPAGGPTIGDALGDASGPPARPDIPGPDSGPARPDTPAAPADGGPAQAENPAVPGDATPRPDTPATTPADTPPARTDNPTGSDAPPARPAEPAATAGADAPPARPDNPAATAADAPPVRPDDPAATAGADASPARPDDPTPTPPAEAAPPRRDDDGQGGAVAAADPADVPPRRETPADAPPAAAPRPEPAAVGAGRVPAEVSVGGRAAEPGFGPGAGRFDLNPSGGRAPDGPQAAHEGPAHAGTPHDGTGGGPTVGPTGSSTGGGFAGDGPTGGGHGGLPPDRGPGGPLGGGAAGPHDPGPPDRADGPSGDRPDGEPRPDREGEPDARADDQNGPAPDGDAADPAGPDQDPPDGDPDGQPDTPGAPDPEAAREFVGNIVDDPKSLVGRSAQDIADQFNAAGYQARVEQTFKAGTSGNAVQVRISGHPEITNIQVHPGGGRHTPAGTPYWKISTSTQGKTWVLPTEFYGGRPGGNVVFYDE